MKEEKQIVNVNKKRSTKNKAPGTTVSVIVHRGGKMEDKELFSVMAVDETHPLLRGIREVLDRAEDGIDVQNDGLDVSRENRADLGIAKAVLRNLRVEIESVRLAALEQRKS